MFLTILYDYTPNDMASHLKTLAFPSAPLAERRIPQLNLFSVRILMRAVLLMWLSAGLIF